MIFCNAKSDEVDKGFDKKINITTRNMFVFVPRISQVMHVLPEQF
jgi:hypothetical protein